MADIKINIDGLRSNQRSIEQKIGDLEALNGRLEALLARIDSSWEGRASEAYISTMRGHKKKAEQMIGVLREFKSYMEQAAAKFESKDRSGAGRINGC